MTYPTGDTGQGSGTRWRALWAAVVFGLGLLAGPLAARAAVPTGADRVALEALYDATDGDNWSTSTNWKTDDGDWYGVTTNNDGEVIRLDLQFNNLNGSIPSALGNLTRLFYLALNDNALSGAIPAALGNLILLEQLDLSRNNLSEAIPKELGELTRLTDLNLYENNLSGTIPKELGDLAQLAHLNLYRNALSGAIPAELGNLINLKTLDLQYNELSGAIPALTTLTQLGRLYLNNNG